MLAVCNWETIVLLGLHGDGRDWISEQRNGNAIDADGLWLREKEKVQARLICIPKDGLKWNTPGPDYVADLKR